MLDIPFARKVLDYVQNHPDEFEMNHFGERGSACGTSACIAGWAMELHPESKPVWTKVDSWIKDEHDLHVLGGAEIDGEFYNEETAGRMLLGLTPDQSENLFYTGDNAAAIELLEGYITDAEKEEDANA